ncbi:PKD domain-containing protein, partial [bacterium]|nr:PKD domain-containing protein [bacterium]
MKRFLATPTLALFITPFFLVLSLCSTAQPFGAGWSNEQVTPHHFLNGYPISMRFLPDGRLLIVEKYGKIKVADPENQSLPVTPSLFMEVPDVEYQFERGVLDLELDPDFPTNGKFYVYYNHIYNSTTAYFRVSKFTTNTGNGAGIGDPSTEVLLWEDDENSFDYHAHYGGSLNFAPDGTLLLSIGEKVGQNLSQDKTKFAGSILRFNTDGTIPADNPLVGNPYGWHEEIYTIGVRQPFRCFMEPGTGRFFISDVGKSSITNSWEDTHILQFPVPGNPGIIPDTPLVNFGHPLHEGYTPPLTPGNYPAGFPEPIFTYPHAGKESAVIGGFVYSGNSFPGKYSGAYFYSDYSRDEIHCLFPEPGGTWRDSLFAISPNPGDFFRPVKGVVSLVQSPSGNFYYINFWLAEIRRISYLNSNGSPPSCGVPTATPSSSTASSQLVSFDPGTPTDPDGDNIQYVWLFGDGNTSTQASPSHTYVGIGTYTAQLSISDGINSVTCDPLTIVLGDPPTATITTPAPNYMFVAGETINFSGTGFDNQDGVLPGTQMEWNVLFNHNSHFHTGVSGYIGAAGSFTIPFNGSHNFSENTGYTACLTVTDSDGLTDTACLQILPTKTLFKFKTSPPGLSILLDGGPQVDGYVLDNVVGFEHIVGTLPTLCEAGVEYQFQSWSDGGANTHTIIHPSSNDSLTATFVPTGNSCGNCGSSTTNGLVARWDFSEGNGATVFDNSGVAPLMDLTIEDPTNVTWVQDGLRFDNPTRAISSAPDTKLFTLCRASNEVSVEAWVEPIAIQTGVTATQDAAALVALSTHPGERSFMVGQRNDATHGRWSAITRTDNTGGTGNPEFDLNTWLGFPAAALMHIVYTRNIAGDEALYVNGSLVESGIATKTGNFDPAWSWKNTAYFSVGGERDDLASAPWETPTFWQGTVYLMSIYDRAITPAEVGQNYQSGCGLPNSVPVNFPPVAVLNATPASGSAPLAVVFNAGNSTDSDGTIVGYAWDLGDAATASTVNATHVYNTPGTYTVSLIVTDDDGLMNTAFTTITVTNGGTSTPIQTTSQVNLDSDDAEENVNGTYVNVDGYALELGYDGTQPQLVGIRFTNIDVPPGVQVTSAYVQFTGDGPDNVAMNLNIYGEAIDNAITFVNINGNISSRPQTNATVAWSPGPWGLSGESGPNQQTSDISAIIQEIINRPGWQQNNALSILIDGTGERLARAYSPTAMAIAPLLVINYNSVGGTSNLPPVAVLDATPTSGSAPLTVAFDAGNSTDSDGNIVGYAWDFGDATTDNTVNPTHIYTTPGTYAVSLVVTDDDGGTGTSTTTITVVSLCAITGITPGTQTACDPQNDTYTQEVLVGYSDAPVTGTLEIHGQSFAITSSPQSVVLTGLSADGLNVDVTATFSDEPGCTLTQNSLFTAPV